MTPEEIQEIVEQMAESTHNAWWATYIELGYTGRSNCDDGNSVGRCTGL